MFANADVILPAIFSDHMVLQRDRENRIWGQADPGEKVTVRIAGQERTVVADESQHWTVTLSPLADEGPHELIIVGKNTVKISDILVGEVWLCSGQSNMEWPIDTTFDGDLERQAPPNSRIRLITVPHVGTQEPQESFEGSWQIASAETIREFSAVGYFFGKQLAETLDVPLGLIDNSWGGSACEAWIDRDRLASHEDLSALDQAWKEFEKSYDYNQVLQEHEERRKSWEAGDRNTPAPWKPADELSGRYRPGNLFNGVLRPLIGYGIRGVVWYQGETNAGRAHQYREMFPMMIQNWRDVWQIGDFPFYWVQLADYRSEKRQPSDSDWAELREAQTMTLDRLSNVGQAVIVDLGNGADIHPRNKRDVALRLARIALARDYGKEVANESPRYKSHEIKDGKIVVKFDLGDQPRNKLMLLDQPRPLGFTIAGEDREFKHATGKLVGPDQVEVWNDEVKQPVAVRYAWADNPVCNLVNEAGLPATPFRTDEWPGITEGRIVPWLLERQVNTNP